MATTGCLVTSGLDCVSCANTFIAPGIQKDKIYIANKDDITNIVASSVSGEVAGIQWKTYKGMYDLCVHKDSAKFDEELQSNANSGYYYTQTLGFRVIDFSTTARNWINSLVGVLLVIAFKTKEGRWLIIGETNGVQLATNTKSTGAASGDELGDVLTFEGEEVFKARRFFVTSDTITQGILDSYLV